MEARDEVEQEGRAGIGMEAEIQAEMDTATRSRTNLNFSHNAALQESDKRLVQKKHGVGVATADIVCCTAATKMSPVEALKKHTLG